MMAPVICSMVLREASRGVSPSRAMRLWQFSTTTMASSTREPMTSTRPNMVRVLMESPRMAMKVKVPRRETGMAMAGTRVARQSWRKR